MRRVRRGPNTVDWHDVTVTRGGEGSDQRKQPRGGRRCQARRGVQETRPHEKQRGRTGSNSGSAEGDATRPKAKGGRTTVTRHEEGPGSERRDKARRRRDREGSDYRDQVRIRATRKRDRNTATEPIGARVLPA